MVDLQAYKGILSYAIRRFDMGWWIARKEGRMAAMPEQSHDPVREE